MAEDASVVRYEIRGHVVTLTIAHPPANAVSGAVLAGIRAGLERAVADAECRVVLLTGDGEKFFAAGADIKEFQTAGPDQIGVGQGVTREIEGARVPVVAVINGMCFGGGCELALSCDVRIAGSNAKLGQPEIKLGIIPGWGGTQRLPRLIGRGPAMDLLLSGDAIDANRALQLGLVTAVYEPNELHAKAMELAEMIAAQAPLSVAATKRAVVDGMEKSLREGLELERGEFTRVFNSADAKEGVSAFLEKRTPTWSGN